MGNNNVKGYSFWFTYCMFNLTEFYLEGDEDLSEDNFGQFFDVFLLDNLIINNDYKEFEKFINNINVDVNVELNEKKEIVLIIVVKFSYVECV